MTVRTLLIPVDFTETSDNAAEYAVGYCRQFNYNRIILLKSFYDTMFDEVVMSAQYGGVGLDFRNREHAEAEERLEALRQKLAKQEEGLAVVTMTSALPLMRAVAEVINDENPRAILLGSDNNAYDNDSYVSGHVIQIAKTSTVNVIIVPAGQRFHPIEEVLIPVDDFTRESLARLDEVSNRPYLGKMKLNILKLDAGQQKNTDRPSADDEDLHNILSYSRHELFSAGTSNTIDAIMDFVKEHPLQLILALPGRYSFLYRLTHKLIADAICRNTEKPVLIVKQFK